MVGMTWTPGGYTATTWDSPPTPANGTVSTTTTPDTMGVTLTANPANNVLGAVYLDGNPTAGPLASQTLRLKYDITVLTQPPVATEQPKNLNQSLNGGPASAGTAGIMLGMNIAATVPSAPAPWAFRFALAPTSAGGGVFAMRSIDNTTLMAFGNYAVGTTYNVELDANYSTGQVDAYINGVKALSAYQFAAGGEGITTSEVFIHLNGETGYANSVSIDNFTVTAPVPEPGTFIAGALLLLPFGAAGIRRFRNQ